jgi:hypothetical protein
MRSARLGSAVVAVLVLIAPACGSSDRADEAPAEAPTTAPVVTIPPGTATQFTSLLPGQCFDQVPDPGQRRYAVMVIGCEDSHYYELYDSLNYTDEDGDRAHGGISYPGETEVRTRAETLCFDAFQPWMGIPWTASEYDIRVFWPSEESWRRLDRTILCAVYRFNGDKTDGSVRGTEQ